MKNKNGTTKLWQQPVLALCLWAGLILVAPAKEVVT